MHSSPHLVAKKYILAHQPPSFLYLLTNIALFAILQILVYYNEVANSIYKESS